MSETGGLVRIADPSRREILRRIALALTAAGAGRLSPAAAQEVHNQARSERQASGSYQPKFLKPHEYRAISRLAELIVPADEQSGSALDAGAPEFIDLLCSQNEELGQIYSGGLLWLDSYMRTWHAVSFTDATEAQQTAVLDRLVEAEAQEPEDLHSTDPSNPYAGFLDYHAAPDAGLAPGVIFFGWVRRMVVDAYYTSPIGIKDLGYVGNQAISKYEVPQVIVDEALRRSPLGPA